MLFVINKYNADYLTYLRYHENHTILKVHGIYGQHCFELVHGIYASKECLTGTVTCVQRYINITKHVLHDTIMIPPLS